MASPQSLCPTRTRRDKYHRTILGAFAWNCRVGISCAYLEGQFTTFDIKGSWANAVLKMVGGCRRPDLDAKRCAPGINRKGKMGEVNNMSIAQRRNASLYLLR